ncbi:hypothetical protein F5884DRAFT_888135 [Xylogone sp. PMI_703]|nr:hypothetical protein F5884DRAFT_888135 [Xylogone sp. PMI_703]
MVQCSAPSAVNGHFVDKITHKEEQHNYLLLEKQKAADMKFYSLYATHNCKDGEQVITQPQTYCKDPANTYLAIRFHDRPDFKSKLSPEILARVEHEERRLERVRANFESYPGKKKMMDDLTKARDEWKPDLQKESANPTRRKQFGFGFPSGWYLRPKHNQVPTAQAEASSKIEDEGDGPARLDRFYDFKACAMYFVKSDSGWRGDEHSHPKYIGKFPNQKMPMHDMLEGKKDNPLSEKCGKDRLRYFHFPSNNMRWIEQAMARYYNEDPADHDDRKPLHQMSKAERLLCREFWRGQLHGSSTGKGPVHARHMRSRCSLVPVDTGSAAYTQKNMESVKPSTSTEKSVAFKSKSKNFAVFLPYLHWETDSRRARMAEVVKEEISKKENKPVRKKDFAEIAQEVTSQGDKKKHKTKLGEYLFRLARVADAMDYAADEQLLRENLLENPPMHIRRTLDQSYFLTLEDTEGRDKDQVVYRETRAGRSFHTRNTRVVMVDQLWLWILDDNTIITSFPRRWGRNKPDPSGVHKSLRERLANTDEGQIQSVYDLALIIIDQCSRVFFDRTKPVDERPEVMDLFASAIGNITELTTIAHETFWRNMEMRAMKFELVSSDHTNQKYLDINPEGVLLREAQDIAEELRIMLRIYNQQYRVVKDLRKALGHMNGESKNERDEIRHLMKLLEMWQSRNPNAADKNPETNEKNVPESTIQEANDLLELIRNRQAEIQDLEDAALRTSQQLEGLLSLKQQQASIIEAKAALRRADESVRQGHAIIAFTIVTIFFLPLGFFAAFFGMNNQEITNSPWMHLSEQIKYMFGLSTVVITIAVSLAFSPWTRAVFTVLIKVPLAFIAEYSGLRGAWNKHIIGHLALERKGQRRLEYIYQRQQRESIKRKQQKENKNRMILDQETKAGETKAGAQLIESFHNGSIV